jgi:ABC-type multidrug transport system fused ATPase/permease subunit
VASPLLYSCCKGTVYLYSSAGWPEGGASGRIGLRQVHCYSAAAKVRSTSIAVRAGQKVALVGRSGCVKSTVIQLLQRYGIAVQAGQKVALVGESGCGKSTVIQLLQRYGIPV